MEAFQREDYQTILTYYIIEAKKGQGKSNEWKEFFLKNLLQTKNAMSGPINKNINKSFDDIINTLK